MPQLRFYFLFHLFFCSLFSLPQLPATLIAGEIGAKTTFAFSIFVPSILHMLMPIAAKHSLTLALLTRAATGAACAPCFPSCFHFFPKWVPLAEKTLMISTVGCGMYLVCRLPLSVSLCLSLSHCLPSLVSGRDSGLLSFWFSCWNKF
jgi:MFS family permease